MKKDKVQKYSILYMRLGMCFGVVGGLIFGSIFSQLDLTYGMALGPPIGLRIGMAIGQAKDERLSENMMIISKMETLKDSSDIVIYVIDKNNIEKQYVVSNKEAKREKFE